MPRAQSFSSRKILISLALLLVMVYLVLSVDTIHEAGDHVSRVVLAPYPTVAFSYGGGEEANPIDDLPNWYLDGLYVYL